ncbi:cyclin-F-like isoform X2 [Numida meleagris]|nr:cyclin-F-like isoform X2 [Numida meleagris]
MSYSQLCSLLGVKQEDPKPSPFYTNGVEIEAFLSSPSGKRTKRRREDSTQDDRGSFVTTPTAELSTQEESLLDSFLDWSLDSCSGYEGDQESDCERDGDVTGPSGILDVTVVYVDPAEHCCQDSSDEDSLSVEWCGHAAPPRKARTPDESHRVSACVASRNPNWEGSSGYSSVNGASPTSSVEGSCGVPLKPTSALSLGNAMKLNSKRDCL